MLDGLHALFTVIDTCETDAGPDLTLSINAHADLFHIHFPDMPIVPGACLAGFAHDRYRTWIGAETMVTDIAQASFVLPVTPGQRLTLELRPAPGRAGGTRLSYCYTAQGVPHAHGILILSDHTEPVE